jgi:ATP-dependent Clp protease ATP-binding subunit ClpA
VDTKFTVEAQRATKNARMDASLFGSAKIETEHLLLGLLREDPAFIDQFLASGYSSVSVREDLLRRSHANAPSGARSLISEYSDNSTRVLKMAADEAAFAGREEVGIDHLLLGLLREEECLAADVLRKHGASLDLVRKELSASPYEPPSPSDKRHRVIENVRKGLVSTAFPNLAASGSPLGTFEPFSDKALLSIFSARWAATQSGSSAIETEHLLSGLLSEEGPHLDLFLPSPGSRENIRVEIKRHIAPQEPTATNSEIPLSSGCERALSNAIEEARKLGLQRVRVAHIVLGLLREEDSLAARLLRDHGVGVESLRARLAALPKQADQHHAEANPSE